MTNTEETTNVTTIITVEDQAGYDALPAGTLLTDIDNDTLVVRPDRQVNWHRDDAEVSTLNDPTAYFPAIVLNPEIFGTFIPAFEEGDVVQCVNVDNDAELVLGDLYTVDEVYGRYVDLISVEFGTWHYGSATRFELAQAPAIEEEADTSVYVNDEDGLGALADGSVLLLLDTNNENLSDVRVKADGAWCVAGKPGTYNFNTAYEVGTTGALVLHAA